MNPPQKHKKPTGFFARINRALGPILGGLALDLLDLATFGPLGLYSGLFIGGSIGWWLAGAYELKRYRWLWATLAGIYCALPFTETAPLATILSAVGRFLQEPADKKDDRQQER